ncbi:hypothetical protein AQUCO_00300117v1 [Aquilegia coerulea]|uniref:MADS-box domain-containing protein n=1 Tax=Aquilegia coerulea TaxID=218851 RepID=A0A2G5EXL3_AQUCA|nr:hypothetical protein AQUCO_00300117v1 [Aquilegia coerulea]
MVRGKVKLAYSLKRMNGMKKRLRDLTTLYAVLTCAIICGPAVQALAVWPYQAKASHEEQKTNFSDLTKILIKRIQKLKKQIEETRSKKMRALMYKFLKKGPAVLRGF